MSSTNRGGERIELDAYFTPDAVACACVATIASDIRGATALDPHAGGGAFARALRAHAGRVVVSDINENAPALATEPEAERCATDFLSVSAGLLRMYVDWTVGNPPFTNAEAHVRHALASSRIGVAFLLRLAFLESTKRRPFWRKHPPAEVHVLPRRPAFLELYEDGTIGPLRKRTKTGNLVYDKRGQVKLAGTDSAAYAWFVWRHGYVGDPRLRWLDWDPS